MVIITRGDWKKSTLADKRDQLATIADKANVYKTTLGIPQNHVDRIVKANTMSIYINTARLAITGYVEGLTAYNDQLMDGDPLQMMNAFDPLPTLGTAPTADLAGIWKFIEDQRVVWMKHANFTPAIGDAMTILGPEQSFDTATYTPTLKITVETGIINVKTDSTHIEVHNLYAAISGQPLKLITSFKGAKYQYHRQLAVPGQAESVDIQVVGLYKNQEVGLVSGIQTIAYKG